MSDVVIRAEHLGKLYHLGTRERYKTLREVLAKPFGRKPHGNDDTLWALKDVSFEIKQGEVVGVIGRNGVGKSTLLKILSRITEPTEGFAEIHGRVGSLLEVGTGFHPELTGRENIYLNGAILGMKRAEISAKFDEIVAFAEIEKFLDTAVKHYSSGMYVRLAFAVAAHLEPEILLVDEVLAVGDAGFQKKCLAKMSEVAGQGRTVILVSHNMNIVARLCPLAIWLESGRVAGCGSAASVIDTYLSATANAPLPASGARRQFAIERVVLRDKSGAAKTSFGFREDITVEIHYHATERIEQPYFLIALGAGGERLIAANMLLDGNRPAFVEGHGVIACLFKSLPLLPHWYSVWFGARHANGVTQLCNTDVVAHFSVDAAGKDIGMNSVWADSMFAASAPFFAPYKWKFPGCEPIAVNGLPDAKTPAHETPDF